MAEGKLDLESLDFTDLGTPPTPTPKEEVEEKKPKVRLAPGLRIEGIHLMDADPKDVVEWIHRMMPHISRPREAALKEFADREQAVQKVINFYIDMNMSTKKQPDRVVN